MLGSEALNARELPTITMLQQQPYQRASHIGVLFEAFCVSERLDPVCRRLGPVPQGKGPHVCKPSPQWRLLTGTPHPTPLHHILPRVAAQRLAATITAPATLPHIQQQRDAARARASRCAMRQSAQTKRLPQRSRCFASSSQQLPSQPRSCAACVVRRTHECRARCRAPWLRKTRLSHAAHRHQLRQQTHAETRCVQLSRTWRKRIQTRARLLIAKSRRSSFGSQSGAHRHTALLASLRMQSLRQLAWQPSNIEALRPTDQGRTRQLQAFAPCSADARCARCHEPLQRQAARQPP